MVFFFNFNSESFFSCILLICLSVQLFVPLSQEQSALMILTVETICKCKKIFFQSSHDAISDTDELKVAGETFSWNERNHNGGFQCITNLFSLQF